MAEFNREETNKLKEKYTNDNCWVQKLFNDFHKFNWHLPNEITAMREVLYEKTGVRVVKPGSKTIVHDRFSPTEGHSQKIYEGDPESEYDWSHYEK